MSIALDRCNGPACPRCGCQDSEILAPPAETWTGPPEQRRWYGAGRARCRHCQMVFHFNELPPESTGVTVTHTRDVVEYVQQRCPDCQSTECVVTTTRKNVRHHKCRACGKTFKSAESI